MPTMTSSPPLSVHGRHHPAKPIIVHHPNTKALNDKTPVISSCEFRGPNIAISAVPLESMPVFAGCNPHCSEDYRRPMITYGFAEPRCGSCSSSQEGPVLEYKVPRSLRSVEAKGTHKQSSATRSSDDGRIQPRRVRTPPPTPKPKRLPSPDLSDLECDTFCTCCNSTNKSARLVKTKSKRSLRIDQEKV